MQKIRLGDMVNVTILTDGSGKRIIGNILGVYGIPPEGGYYWWKADNSAHGDCNTEEEAIAELKAGDTDAPTNS